MKSRTSLLMWFAVLVVAPVLCATAQDSMKLEGHERELYAVAYSADGKTLASTANDRTIRVWNLSAQTNTVIKLGYAPSKAVALSNDGAIVAGRLETGAAMWDSKTGNKLASLVGDPSNDGPVHRLRFSPDGAALAVGHERGTVRVWDVGTNKSLRTIAPRGETSNAVTSLAYSPDGNLLAIGYENGLGIVATKGDADIKYLSEIKTLSVSFTPDNKKLIANQQGNVGACQIWSVHDSKLVFAADQSDRNNHFLSMLSPIDSSTALGVDEDGKFESFDLNRMKRTNKKFQTPYKLAPGGFAISPDGQVVANYFGGNLYQIHLQPIRFE